MIACCGNIGLANPSFLKGFDEVNSEVGGSTAEFRLIIDRHGRTQIGVRIIVASVPTGAQEKQAGVLRWESHIDTRQPRATEHAATLPQKKTAGRHDRNAAALAWPHAGEVKPYSSAKYYVLIFGILSSDPDFLLRHLSSRLRITRKIVGISCQLSVSSVIFLFFVKDFSRAEQQPIHGMGQHRIRTFENIMAQKIRH